MNFDCVGTDEKGRFYMKMNKPFTIVEKIQLLQRWVLVQSYAYYELDNNIISDFKYDTNVMQLKDMVTKYPEEARRSKYFKYFHDFFEGEFVNTSGFNLIQRVKSMDEDLYELLNFDATLALQLQEEKQNAGDTNHF